MRQDRVTLAVPARGEYARTVRLTAASLASRTNMTVDQVDDVRIAAEEAFVYASDSIGEEGTVEIVFIVDDDSMSIEVSLGELSPLDDEDTERRTTYATFILQSVCDQFELASDEDGAHLRVTKNADVGGGDAD
jgi:serine/threonine-protein kinase RsbW